MMKTWPAAGQFTPQLTPSIAGEVASPTDVTITMRYFEHAGEIQRAITVMQTRGSAHDPSIRQVRIDGDGHVQLVEVCQQPARHAPKVPSPLRAGQGRENLNGGTSEHPPRDQGPCPASAGPGSLPS